MKASFMSPPGKMMNAFFPIDAILIFYNLLMKKSINLYTNSVVIIFFQALPLENYLRTPMGEYLNLV